MDSLKNLTFSLHWFFGLVSFLPYIVIETFASEQFKQRLRSMTSRLQAKRTGNDFESPYRCVENMDKLLETSYNGQKTISKVFEAAVRKCPQNPCLGTRELLSEEDEKQPNGKIFKKAIFGSYKWETYSQVHGRVVDVGRGLSMIGQKPEEKIAIFLETRAEWMIAIHACFRSSFPAVTVYATLGEEGVCHALNETEVTCVITSATLLNTKLTSCLQSIPKITDIVYVEDNKLKPDLKLPERVKIHPLSEVNARPRELSLLKASKSDPFHIDFASANVESMKKIENLGKSDEGKRCPSTEPDEKDLAIVMYTSGQSGDPKGVLISHYNFVAAMSGMESRVPNLNSSDSYIGYLPLAHVLELAAENVMLAAGARIGYSSPLTLSDRSSRIKKGSSGDATVLKPTLMAAVPEIVERMRKAIMQGVAEMSPALRKVFHWAYAYKLKQVERGYDTPMLNRVIFKKSKALLGGNVRAMLSGGAPMDTQTQRFMNVCMCSPVVQGYGLTETCGATSISQILEDFSTGRVGPPLPCCEVKLVPWEEGGYFPSNKPHAQGEIHIGGANITQGYFKKPEKTAEEFYVDDNGQRWFKTGDIGQVDYDGALRIVDRKKDLVKLSHGEYLALGSIEAKLKASPLIDNIWIFADGSQPYAIAFVIPNEKNLMTVAKSKGISADNLTQLCKEPLIEQEMKNTIIKMSKSSKLQKFEIPQKLYLDPKPWLPEDGLTTAAFKLKRKALENHYRESIDALYGA